MIQYSLEVTICWSLLFLIYFCFLKRETFFSINRGYLLSSLIVGLVIPLLRMIDWQWQEDVVLSNSLQFIAAGPNYIATSITPEPMSQQLAISMLDIVSIAYWIGVLFMSIRLLKGISKIYRLYQSGQKSKQAGFTLVETNQYHLPFSFLHCVFFSKELALNKDVEHIIKHELTHIKSRHSYDVFFVEILHVLFWWNPLIYLYKKELRQLHEYLADAMVLTGTNQKIYGQILLGQSESGLEIALTHQFFNSHLKQRIMMMYKQKSRRPAMIKYLVALPVIAFLAITFSSYLNIDTNQNWAKTMEQRFNIYNIQPTYGNNIQSIFIRTGNMLNDEALNKQHVLKHFKNLSQKYNFNFEVKSTDNNTELIYTSETLEFIYNVNSRSKQFTFKDGIIEVPDPIGTELQNVTFLDLNEHDKSLFKSSRNYAEMLTANGNTFLSGCCTEIAPADIKADQVYVTRGSSSDFEIYLYRTDENLNSDLLNELNDYFATHRMIVGESDINKSFFKLRKKYPDFLAEIDRRFDLEAKKHNTAFGYIDSGDENRFTMVSCGDDKAGLVSYSELQSYFNKSERDTIPPTPPGPPPAPPSPDEIAALIKNPNSQHKIFLDGKEITKQEFIEKESSIFLRTYTPIEQTDDRFIRPELHGSIYYRTSANPEPRISSEISLNSFNVPHGSVKVKAGDQILKEGIDYEVDYQIGRVKIVNDAYLQEHIPIHVSIEDGEIFKVVEQMPRFPGCEDMSGTKYEKEECAKEKMLDFIYQNLKYPEAARKAGVEGMTVVQFVINPAGRLQDLNLVRDIGGGAGEAAREVVELMNEKNLVWTPGIQKGKKVHVLYTLPVRFKLNEKQKQSNYNKQQLQEFTQSMKDTSEDDKLHYILYTVNDCDDNKVKRAKKAIVDYHNQFFKAENLRVSSIALNEKEKVYAILVRKFDNRDKVSEYASTTIKNILDYLSQSEFDFNFYPVTQESYKEIVKEKSIEKYILGHRLKSISGKVKVDPFKALQRSRDPKRPLSLIYDFIAPLQLNFEGSFPLIIVNDNKYVGSWVDFNAIDITKDQIQSVEYLSPTRAKSKYGDIAFHGALEIQLNNITEAELEKIGKIITPGSQVLSIADKEEVFKVVEQMPRFPDCEDKCVGTSSIEDCHKEELLNFIDAHLVYPEEARKAGIEGMAVVQFIIDKTGTVIEPKVVRDIGGGTAKEVLYVVELMNNLTKKWTPGYQRGQAVNVLYTLPVRFKLGDNKQPKIPLNNVDVSQNKASLTGYELKQNRPNPVSEETIIEFQLPEAAQATLRFYNVEGKTIFKITDQFNKSTNVVKIKKADLPTSGVIYYELESGTFKSTRKMVVLE